MAIDAVDPVDNVEGPTSGASVNPPGNSIVSYGANVNIYGPTQVKVIGPDASAGFVIKQSDTLPWLRAQLQDADGNGVDLTGAEVRFHMRLALAQAPQVNADCALDLAADGKVSYRWQVADTSVPGTFSCDFRVIFADGTALSFPNDSEFPVRVEGSVALTSP